MAALTAYVPGSFIVKPASASNDCVPASKNLNDDIIATYLGTGKGYAQFVNGFDYDIFISADTTYPNKIVSDGNAIGEPKIYALGVVALYSNNEELIKKGMDSSKDEKVKHISIANPAVAPYGVAAMEIIENYGLKVNLPGQQ